MKGGAVQLDAARIAGGLPAGSVIGREIEVLAEVDSTSDEIQRRAEAGAREGIVVFAEAQRRGRGRRGASWVSPPGKDLLFSVLLRPAGAPAGWTWLTHGAAVAICRVTEAFFQVPGRIKWPNDVFLPGDRKVSGILLETRPGREPGGGYAVLGIGINVNSVDFPGHLGETAVSLRAASGVGEDVEREPLAAAVLAELDAVYGLDAPGKEILLREAEQRSLYSNRRLAIGTAEGAEGAQGVVRGLFRGLGAAGELRILDDKGVERWFSGAENVRIIG